MSFRLQALSLVMTASVLVQPTQWDVSWRMQHDFEHEPPYFAHEYLTWHSVEFGTQASGFRDGLILHTHMRRRILTDQTCVHEDQPCAYVFSDDLHMSDSDVAVTFSLYCQSN